MERSSTHRVRIETRTRASAVFGVVAVLALVVAFGAPAFASRSAIQDLFFILTMLVLAQCWNLLAGYAGLVSVGQQAFVGFGAYALFAAVNEETSEGILAPDSSSVTGSRESLVAWDTLGRMGRDFVAERPSPPTIRSSPRTSATAPRSRFRTPGSTRTRRRPLGYGISSSPRSLTS